MDSIVLDGVQDTLVGVELLVVEDWSLNSLSSLSDENDSQVEVKTGRSNCFNAKVLPRGFFLYPKQKTRKWSMETRFGRTLCSITASSQFMRP